MYEKIGNMNPSGKDFRNSKHFLQHLLRMKLIELVYGVTSSHNEQHY